MASPTNDKHDAPAQQKPMAAPAPASGAAATPTLAEDLDAVLLLRLYPDLDAAAARARALADGKATQAAGATLEASQQQPLG